MTEQQIQKKILTMLEKDYDAYVVKVVSANKSGVPDIVACIDGRFIGIEVKRPASRSTVSPLQAYNLDKIEEKGGLSMVAWNVEMVREFLEEML